MNQYPVPDSPYVGLVPFSEVDHALFFGREADTERVIANLFGPRLTLLYGPSGVGKTSLLNAGVLHSVNEAEGSVGAVFRDWSQTDPLSCIAREVEDRVHLMKSGGRSATSKRGEEISTLNSHDAESLARRISEAGSQAPSSQIMVLLDQFEDYFLYVLEESESADAQLAEALTGGPHNVSFLLAIREDSLALLDRFTGLVPGLFDNYLRIDPLSREGAEEAIVKPLEVFRDADGGTYSIEPDLVSSILGDLEGASVWPTDRLRGRRGYTRGFEAALIQLVMDRLWEEDRRSDDHTLHLSTYQRLEGSRAIIRDYLNRVMKNLGPDDQSLAHRIFGELVTDSGDKIAHRLDHLVAKAYSGEDEVRALLDQLLEKKIVRLVDVNTETYEVYHDILARAIRRWRSDYESAIDPFAPARRSRRRRLQRALELAKSDSRDQLLKSIEMLTELARNRVDLEVSEQAYVNLQRMARDSTLRARELGLRRGVRNEVETAVSLVEIDKLGLNIDEALREVDSSTGGERISGFDRHQIERAVATVTTASSRLLELIDSENPTIRDTAIAVVNDIYYATEDTGYRLTETEPSLAGYGRELETVASRFRERAADESQFYDLEQDGYQLSEYDEPSELPVSNPWLGVAVSVPIIALLIGLILGTADWLLDMWLGGFGWTAPSGAPWVLVGFGLLVGVFAAWVAYDDTEAFGLSEGLLTAAIITGFVVLIGAIAWVVGNLLGLMAHQTFEVSLDLVAYVSAVGVPLLFGGFVVAIDRF